MKGEDVPQPKCQPIYWNQKEKRAIGHLYPLRVFETNVYIPK